MKKNVFLSFLFFIYCITVDESGKIISGPEFLIKKNSLKKWELKEVPLGPRWQERELEIPLLLTPVNYDIPEKHILSNVPEIINQGRLASSTACAAGYLAFSYYIQKKLNKEYLCSPSFVYNLLNGGKDEGIEILDSLYLLKNSGCIPISMMPYKDFDYKIQPNPFQIKVASQYKLNNFARLDPLDIYQIATFVRNDQIIITTIFITENFLNTKKKIYEPEGKMLGKHTVGIIGYDIKNQMYYIQNSAGKDWGDSGYIWISKNWYDRLVINAYVIID